MAFQVGGFQIDAFQTGVDGLTPQDPPTTVMISDGSNEAVAFAYEELEQLYTAGNSVGQLADGGKCQYPIVSGQSADAAILSTATHDVTLPTFAAGDRILILVDVDKAVLISATDGFNIAANAVQTAVLYKTMDGTEGSTTTITFDGPTRPAWSVYVLVAGTFSDQIPEVSTEATSTSTTPDPPSLSTTWNDKTLIFALTASTNVETYSAYPYVNGIVTAASSNVSIASCYTLVDAQTTDPGTFTASTGVWYTLTIAQQGLCDAPEPKQIWPDVYELDLELPSGEGFSQGQAPYSVGAGGSCVFPEITSYVQGSDSAVSTHTITLPTSLTVGDGLIVGMKIGTTQTATTTPSGWEAITRPTGVTGAPLFLYRVVDGTEAATIDVVSSASCTAAWTVWRLRNGTFASGLLPSYGEVAGTTASADPPILADYAPDQVLSLAGASGSSSNPAITAFSTGYGQSDQIDANTGSGDALIGWAARQINLGSINPSALTLTGTVNQSFGWHLQVRGLCGFEAQEPNLVQNPPDVSELGFDPHDYQGTVEKELPEDVDLPQGIWSGGNNEVGDPTYTDFTDYGTQWAPRTEDPEGCGFPYIARSLAVIDSTLPTVNVSFPTGVAAGDLVITCIATGNAGASWTTPTGWTQFSSTSGNGLTSTAFWCRYTATQGASDTFTQTGGDSDSAVTTHLIKGWDGFEPPVASVVSAVTSTSIDPPSVAYTWTDPSLFITYLAFGSTTSTVSAHPTGYGLETETDVVSSSLTLHSDGKSALGATPEDPGAYTITTTATSHAYTIAVKGFCGPAPLYSQTGEAGYDLHNDTDFTDYGSFTPRGVPDLIDTGDCLYPSVVDYTSALGSAGTAHSFALPSGRAVGDRVIAVFQCTSTTGHTITAHPAGWTLLLQKANAAETPNVYWRDLDGSESTVDFTSSATATYISSMMRLKVGTFDPNIATSCSTLVTATNTTTADPPNLASGFPSGSETLWIALGTSQDTSAITFTSYPTNFNDNQNSYTQVPSGAASIQYATRSLTTTPEDPGVFTWTGAQSTTSGITLAVKGTCGYICVQSDQVPDDSYGWDFEDYGTQSDPQIEDYIEPILAPQVTPDDGEILVDDFDYGTQSDPLADDVDLAQGIWDDGNTRDDTDYADYGFSVDPLADDVDLGQSIIDDGNNRDDTDYADYGFSVAPLADDNDLPFQTRDDGTNLEDPTGADWFEYGTQTDPLADDFPQDQLLGLYDATEFEDATFTDWAEYGTQNEAYETFVNPEDLLWGLEDGTTLDDPTGADWFEYGTQSDPQIDDADLGQAIISDGTNVEDPTFTDFTDYGTQSDPQIEDADLGQAIIDSGVTVEDPTFTDFTDYGTQNTPLAPDFPEDFILGIDSGNNVEDATGADWFEYGAQSDPLADDVDLGQSIIEDGNTRDDTDYADYGFSVDPLADDNDLPFQTRDDGTNLEDPTGADWFEYGSQSDPLAPDFPEDQILGIDDGTNLDDPTQTDTANYGTQSDILLFLQQDFNLGTGDGLDYQDFTDTADYGFTQDSVSKFAGGFVSVPVTGIVINVLIGCFHTYGFGAISDPSTAWTPATDPTTPWTPGSPPATTWTMAPDGSAAWSPITDPSDPGWEKDC